jgi:hypothetical protein
MSKIFVRSALILCLGSWSASAAFAQQVSLTMNNGRVTLKATNATVRQILDEWARVGGTKIVNAEKVTGQPVTLTLIDQPEGQALETVLRTAAGYMVSERANPTATGSRYDRILLMARTTPVTSSPASTSANNANAYTANGPMPPGGAFTAEGPVTADDDEPPQPTAPVVNPYAQAAQQGGTTPGTGAPGAVSGNGNNNGVPGMGTGLGQQQQQGVTPNPGYNSIAGQPGAVNQPAASQPEKFDYANPQKYFQQQQQQQQQQQNMQPYPGVQMSPAPTGTGSNSGSQSSSTPPIAGTGAAGTITPQQTTPAGNPANVNPYSPNFNPYNLPAGTPQQSTPVTPDRSKYSNPYSQPTQPPQ